MNVAPRGSSDSHMRLAVLTVAAALLCLPTRAPAQQVTTADLVLHRGKIVTLDDRDAIVSAIAVRDGRIVAVGDESLVSRFRASRVIDLNGRMAMPGFNDTHIHVSGRARREIALGGVRSIRELQDSVRAKVRLLGPGQWITGIAWAEDNFSERRLPLKADLDAAAPDNPVFLLRAGGHSSVSNSMALRLAGISRDTPQPDAGMIEHDARGEPTGIIRERGDLIGRVVPRPSVDEMRDSFVQALRDLFALGITSITQAGANSNAQGVPAGVVARPEWPEWARVYRENPGTLPRATVQIFWRGTDDLRALGKRSGDGDEWLRVGAVKLLVDGGFTGPSAYTLAPYKGMAEFRGTLNLSPDSLYQVVKAVHAMGWQMGFHTIGDAAIQLTVDAFDRVLRETSRRDQRHYLNQFSMLPPVATLETMARDSILVTQQPNFTYTLESRYQQVLDSTRLVHNNPLATPMRHGIFMAFSSDVLPIGPLTGIYAAVTRKGKSGAVYGANEAVPMSRALRAYTRDGAFFTREERLKGTLEPGKLADIIVLSQDLLTIPPDRILDTMVDLTVLGGRVVYDRRAEVPRRF